MIALGVQLSVGGASVAEIVNAARAYDEAGVESVWVGSHLIDYYDQSRTVPESLVMLAAIATSTESIRLGSLAVPAVRSHPSLLAKFAGTLDELADGRFELGIGAGGTRGEFRALGMEFPRSLQRVDRLEQALQLLRALRAGGPVDLDIDGMQLEHAWCRPTFERTPIVVAALGPRTAQLAGLYADEVNTIDYAIDYDAAVTLQRAAAVAASAGRPLRASVMVPAASERAIGGGAHPDAGPARAQRLGAHRIIYRVLPPYPTPIELFAMAGR